MTSSDVRIPDRRSIEDARTAITPHVRTTPVLTIHDDALGLDHPVVLKLEHHQVTGSFKARGAFTLLLDAEVPDAGIVGASGGNAGLAFAYAARRLGHRATIFVPDSSPATKIERLQRLGADVRVVAGFYAEALTAAEQYQEGTGALWTHAYDLPGMVAGAGTLAAELGEQTATTPLAGIDTVLVAVGGGGLIAGIASWFRGEVRVVGVETQGTATLHRALEAGAPTDVDVSGIAASSLGARRIGNHCWQAREWIDDALLVTDDEARAAQSHLWDGARIAAEPGGAVALAACTSGRYEPAGGERVAAIVCGANMAPADLPTDPLHGASR